MAWQTPNNETTARALWQHSWGIYRHMSALSESQLKALHNSEKGPMSQSQPLDQWTQVLPNYIKDWSLVQFPWGDTVLSLKISRMTFLSIISGIAGNSFIVKKYCNSRYDRGLYLLDGAMFRLTLRERVKKSSLCFKPSVCQWGGRRLGRWAPMLRDPDDLGTKILERACRLQPLISQRVTAQANKLCACTHSNSDKLSRLIR